MNKITEVLKTLNLKEDEYELYGNDIAKVNFKNFASLERKAKLVLMTSINPTPAGEGKTTTAIGLTDGLNYIGKKAILALREPSLGPVFGRKGTATGGGESEVIPMDKINLHFTGDIHAITTANNLISASIDSELYWGNKLNIDPENIIWKRCLDLNDRALRKVDLQISKTLSRKEEFTITAASNMMTILSLSKNEEDLRCRLNESIVAYDLNGEEVLLEKLGITGSLMALLKDAIKPNFVLTKHNSPTFVHCGPFANIATGTNSVISTDLALKLGEYAIVESGFGSDLGFEKFMNVVNEQNSFIPHCVVMVVTLRALNLHKDFENNFEHLEKHISHIKNYDLNFLVAINFIEGDDENQLTYLKEWLDEKNYPWEINEAYVKGPKGAEKLAKKVVEISNTNFTFRKLINPMDKIENKISKITENFYFLKDFSITDEAKKEIEKIENSKYRNLPLCMVKSHSAIDGNETKDKNYLLKIKNVRINSGAKFILVFTNAIMSMPGLNKEPNSKSIDVENDRITGLK
ncbi:formate--tetrahydrofolate ligase [Spiroplasma apis]|uniref:Formate--tetrahydrofolate ligase n=1 Tax=Spiroplasma apis B31 TaxID=1276258 RepID=V5RHH4_SPIAP|nr:formate--tetrahydrofolate ligase [Spiroplasma apis]AHB35984.1 formate--tetrahydrofolate ligase [Spiroplasma apis B31]